MNLKSFANFQPFNDLRSEMGASRLGKFDVSKMGHTAKKADENKTEAENGTESQPTGKKKRSADKTVAKSWAVGIIDDSHHAQLPRAAHS